MKFFSRKINEEKGITTAKEASKWIKDHTNKEYMYLSGFNTKPSDSKCLILHDVCCKPFKVLLSDFMNGERCPFCDNEKKDNTSDESKPETVYLWKDIHKDVIYNKIKEHYRGTIRKDVIFFYNGDENNYNKIDLYFPDLKVGIDLVDYYKNTENFNNPYYFFDKQSYFRTNHGVKLYFIDRFDYFNNPEAIYNWLYHLLDTDYRLNKKIVYAKDCDVYKMIDAKTVSNFINKYSITKRYKSNYTFEYALYYNNYIIAMMTFIVNEDNTSAELVDYVPNPNYIMCGGFSKLLKYSVDNMKSSLGLKNILLYTYVDRSLYSGDIFYKLKWDCTVLKPTYYIFNKDTLKKEKSLYVEELDSHLNQIRIKKLTNTVKIYNCGYFKFSKKY